ncbi:hypothetical protein [Neobacillus cucumis]|uniref:hypothetical protein n=1 Tax=Neobacillus cucumis TaxID=1740721 RepID=UPI0019640B77|nr:hypothetical protein [Neobacillus cucumis]MBM7655486.1 quinol monooxygenase YgiN [Neobacillus cucumis]
MGKFRLRSGLISRSNNLAELVNILHQLSNNFVECNYFNVSISLKESNLVIVDAEWDNESSFQSSLSSENTNELVEQAKSMISGIILNKSETW